MRYFSIVSLLFLFFGAAYAEEKPILSVYTYHSFAADWGPGLAIEQAFEEECDCDLQYIALDDGVALLNRIRLEGDNTKADIVLGLDTNLMAEAIDTGLFAPHGLNLKNLALPMEWKDKVFAPFDYGYFAFVYDKTKFSNPPESLAALVDGPADEKILLQDPRTSTPGLGLLLWMQRVFGDEALAKWEKLNKRVLTVSKGWSEAYGLFLKGEAPMVLSYTTSPAYHMIEEEKNQYAAALFNEGHYLQVEVGAKLTTSQQPDLAAQFLSFMVSENFQRHIPTGNWMYPVIDLVEEMPPEFTSLQTPEKTLSFTAEEVQKNRKLWISQWLDVMSR